MTETTQRSRILEALGARGWEVAASVDGDWWADEVLVMRSIWSPIGASFVLTFLVDPQHDGPRKKGENVWAVAASKQPRTDRTSEHAGPLLSLGRGWETGLGDFLHAVDTLRT